MLIFMNEYYTKKISISGIQYYMIEMMQYLQDVYNIQNIKELINPLTTVNRKIVQDRYSYAFDIITSLKDIEIDKLVVTMNSLLYLLQSDLYIYLLLNVEKIYLLNADGILELLKKYTLNNLSLLSKYKNISDKVYLLHEPGFENDFYNQCTFKIVPIIRGLYFKNFVSCNTYIDKYFMFTINHETIYTHTEKDIQKAQTYCMNNDIQYTSKHSINPSSTYSGLIYFRYHDYMPRLPYEFWYYDKDVKIVQISDGLEKRLKRYGKNVYNWNLDEFF